MSRWIDADVLKEKLKASPSYRDYEWAMYAEEFIEEMDSSAPSIDLVRCKECKWHSYDTDDECRWRIEEIPNDDDFCSRGKRRE